MKDLEKSVFIGPISTATFVLGNNSEPVAVKIGNVHLKETVVISKESALYLVGETIKRFRVPSAPYCGQITKVTECPKVNDGEGMVVEKLILELNEGQLKFTFPADVYPSYQWPKVGGWATVHFGSGSESNMIILLRTLTDPKPIAYPIQNDEFIDIDF